MKFKKNISIFFIFCVILFIIDRIAKFWALSLSQELIVNQFLSLHLTFNRGISWGFFYSEESMVFFLMSSLIVLLTIAVCCYAISRYKKGYSIFGEMLVLTGSISNIFDRIYYHGVIDFILLSYKSYSWPVFNVADCMIVCGVVIMLVQVLREK
jgi:signal peptidase II